MLGERGEALKERGEGMIAGTGVSCRRNGAGLGRELERGQ